MLNICALLIASGFLPFLSLDLFKKLFSLRSLLHSAAQIVTKVGFISMNFSSLEGSFIV